MNHRKNLCRFRRALMYSLVCSPALSVCQGDERIAPADTNLGRPVDFARDIAPIFRANCVACHNRTKSEGDLVIETVASILQGGSSGELVVPGKPDESYLYNVAARVEESFMPPLPNTVQAKALSPEEVGLLRQWIVEGAKAGSTTASSQMTWQAINSELQAIYSLDTDPVGRFVAAGRAGNVTVYDLARQSAERLQDPALVRSSSPQQKTHQDYVNAIAFHPGGQMLATSGYRVVKLWARGRKAIVQPQPALPTQQISSVDGVLTVVRNEVTYTSQAPLESEVQDIEWSPDNKSAVLLLKDGALHAAKVEGELISAGPAVRSDQGNFQQIHLVGGSLVCVVEKQWLEIRAADTLKRTSQFSVSAEVVSVALSADGTRIASVDAMGVARLWDAKSGKSLAALEQDLDAVRRLTSRTADQSVRDARVRVFKSQITEDEKRVTEQQAGLKKSEEAATKAEKTLEEAKKKREEEHMKVVAAEQALAAKPEDAGLKKKLTDAQAAANKSTEAVTAAESSLKSARKGIELSKQAIVRAESQVNRRRQRLAESEVEANAAAVSVSQIKDAAAVKVKSQFTAFAGDRVVATFDPNGTIRLWKAADGSGIDVIEHAWDESFRPVDVVSSGDHLLAITGSGSLKVDPFPGWTLAGVLGTESGDSESTFADRVLALAFSPDGSQLAAGGGEASRSGELTLWDVATGSLAKTFRDAHSDTVYGVDFSRDGKYLASAAADKFVKVFDLATGDFVRAYEGHTHHVMDVSWNGDGTKLASAGADNAIKVWNAETGEQSRTITTYRKQVTALEFIGMEDEFISSSGDKRVFRHKAANGGTVREFKGCPDYVYCSATTANGQVVAAGCEDGVLRIWDGKSGKEIASFKPSAGQ